MYFIIIIIIIITTTFNEYYKLHHHSLSVSAERQMLNYIEPCIIHLKKLLIPYMHLQFHTQVQIILTALKCLTSPSLLRDDHFTPTKSYLQQRPRGLRYLDLTRNSDPLALFPSWFNTLVVGLAPGSEPVTFRFAVKRSTDWARPSRRKRKTAP